MAQAQQAPTAGAGPTTYLLLDLNGNLHVGDSPTRDAIAALDRLSQLQQQQRSSHGRRLRIAFCSNSSKEATSTLVSRLRRMGFSNEQSLPTESVFTSLDACKRLCERLDRRRTLLLLGEDAQGAFDDPGPAETSRSSSSSRWLKATPDRLPSDLSAKETADLRECDSVVIGLAPGVMRYEWLDEAFRILSNEYHSSGSHTPLLIGTHRGMYYRPGNKASPAASGSSSGGQAPLSLGPGAFITALESAAGLKDKNQVKAVGKPSREFFAECLAGMGWSPDSPGHEAWIVGDDAVQDLSLPAPAAEGDDPLRNLSIHRALVKSGKYRQGDEQKVNQGGPDGVWDDFASWVDWFEKQWTTS